MALKPKGRYATTAKRKVAVPKADPKKRRAKSEEEMIRAAVDEHGKRGVKARRKSGKVNAFRYKETVHAANEANTAWHRHQLMREPHGLTPFEEFTDTLADDARVFATTYWHMQCAHADEEVISQTASFVEGASPEHLRCRNCGLVRRWQGSKTETKRHEWMSYCPDGYDMFEWGDLYVGDRSLWQYIHDECLAEMVAA
jgi:hypothetical protein